MKGGSVHLRVSTFVCLSPFDDFSLRVCVCGCFFF